MYFRSEVWQLKGEGAKSKKKGVGKGGGWVDMKLLHFNDAIILVHIKPINYLLNRCYYIV